MTRREAAELAAELQELAVEGRWPELLDLRLPDELIELARQLGSLNTKIELLEQQERVLEQLIISMLIDHNTTTTEVQQ